jgi:hypothetical protein
MLFSDAIKLYDAITRTASDTSLRMKGSLLRTQIYSEAINTQQPITKLAFDKQLSKTAFDTRRIDQENDRNPRRNLQYYHRSEPYIDEDLSTKIAYIMKIKNATDLIKEQYGTDPEWFDSYARILGSAVDRALRSDQKDGDFFKASFDYLDELLYVRYRLAPEDIQRLGEREIERVILGRDEAMVHKHLYKNSVKTAPESNDPLVERLLAGVKATGENKNVERTVSISVRDTILDKVG